MKIRLIPLLLVSLLALNAIHPAFAEEGVAAPKEDAPKDKGEGGDKKKGDDNVSGGRFVGDPIYVHVPPMVLPVITDSGVEQLVTVVMDVQVKDFDAADKMRSEMPRVQDSLMRALYGGLGQGTLRKGKLVDVTKVKNKAVAAVGEVIGIDHVQDVLVQSVAQRML